MRIIIGLLTGLVLVVVLCGATVTLILNSQWFQNFAEVKLSEIIGQNVTIASIRLDPGAITRIRVEQASVANPSWASNPFLASVDVLTIGIDVFELLGGDLVLADVQLIKPVVHLETSAQDRANWQLEEQPPPPQNDQDSAGQDEDEDGVTNVPRIESLSVDNGLLTYVDTRQDTSLKLSFKSLNQNLSPEQGRIIAKGGGQLLGQPLEMSLSAGPAPVVTKNNTNNYPLKLQLSSGETSLLMEGTVDAPISPEMANLQFHLNGENLSRWNDALDMQLPALPMYQVAGHVGLEDGVWSIDELNATVVDSDLTGTLRVIPDADPLRVEGNFSSEHVDIAQLQGFMPDQENSEPVSKQVANLLAFLANASMQTKFKYRSDLLKTQETPITDAEVVMSLENHALTVETLFGTIDENHGKVEGYISANSDLTGGRIQLKIETTPTIGTAKDSEMKDALSAPTFPMFPGNLSIALAMNVATKRVPVNENQASIDDEENSVARIELDSVAVEEFHVTYTDTPSSTKLVARLKEDMSKEDIVIEADGKYKDAPLGFSFTIPDLTSLVKLNTDESLQRLTLDLKLADAMASVTASVMPTWPVTKMNMRFQVSSDTPASIAALFGIEVPTLGKLAIRGSLSKQHDHWKLDKFVSQVGQSNLNMVGIINTADELRVKATLKSNLLDVAALIPQTPTEGQSSKSTTSDGSSAKSDSSERMSIESTTPPWLTDLTGQISLEVQRLVLPGATLNNVSAKATIDQGRLRVVPLSIALGGGTIKTRVNLNVNTSAPTGTLRTEIQGVDLGEALTAFGKEPSALGVVDGRIGLKLPDVSHKNIKNTSNTDALLDRLEIEEVRLQYDDPDLQAKTDLRLKADSFKSDIRIEGKVEYQGIPVDVSLKGGTIRQAIQDYRSLPVNATFQIKKTTLDIESHVGRLFPLESLTTSLRLAGPDLFRFGKSIKIPLPHLPPYDLHANLERKQLKNGTQVFIFTNLEGTIGDSDVAGKLRVTTGGERPMIFTRLHSRKLDLDDLAGLTGAPPDPEETASEKQKAQAEKFDDRERLLPAKPIDFTQLQKVDADVDYRAKNVQAPDLPLDDFVLTMTLQNGHMQMNRLDFGVAKGTAAMELEVNARQIPVKAKLKTDFDQVNLSKLFTASEMTDDAFGNIGGKGTLWMRGTSLADWFASADGGLYLTMTGGKMDALLIELAGLDFTESATVFLGTDTGVPIDCAYTDLQTRSGIVTIQPFLFDTSDTKFKGHGKIDLRQEKMDLTVEPFPKDFTFLSSRGPLHVAGTFKNPNFSVDPSIPSPEFGTADNNARCDGMIEDLRKARKRDMDERKREFETVK
ncbi:AsmA family protein [Candidatus Nitrospira salsa]